MALRDSIQWKKFRISGLNRIRFFDYKITHQSRRNNSIESKNNRRTVKLILLGFVWLTVWSIEIDSCLAKSSHQPNQNPHLNRQILQPHQKSINLAIDSHRSSSSSINGNDKNRSQCKFFSISILRSEKIIKIMDRSITKP